MLKNILKLNGAKKLSTNRQQNINGGGSGQCQVGCAGLPDGARCYGFPGCEERGRCCHNQCHLF